MSDARVNLLPGDVRERQTAARARVLTGLAIGGVLVVLGGAWFWKNSQIDDARALLDEEQAAVQALQAEVAELNEYATIQAELADADENVATVMGGEIGVAGVLQDLAMVLPSGVELESLSLTATPENELITIGQLLINGRTIDRHAPGLERVLLELDKVAAFRAPYFGSAAVDNDEAVTFDVSVQLGTEVLTRRYFDGIPEVLR